MIEPDNDKLPGKFKRKNLDGLSPEQLTAYCRELESSRAEYMNTLNATKDYAKRLVLKLEGKHRVGQHPAERSPNPNNWTCFHPKTAGKDNKGGPCGRSNPHYETKLIWKEVTHCRTCKGPYNEDFEFLKLQIPKRKGLKSKHNADEAATPDARQSLTNVQVNDAANALANDPAATQLSNFHAFSNTQQDSLCGASTGYMHGLLGEDEQFDARHLSTSWHSNFNGHQQTPLSDRFHSTPMDDTFISTVDSTANYYPMRSPGSQSLNTTNTDSLNLNMGFTGQNGEFDEFAKDSDLLFMDMDMDSDPNPQQARSYLEDTNIFEGEFPQFENSFEQHAGHYPAQLNLFSRPIGSLSQAQNLPSLPQPYLAGGIPIYGSGSGLVPNSIEQHEHSSSWAPTQLEQPHKLYQSLYGPIGASIPTKAPDGQTETLSPYPWSSQSRRISTPRVPKAKKVQNGPGRGCAGKPPTSKPPRAPSTRQRPSRSNAAKAERAALKEGGAKTPVLTESQISKVRTRNNTSAIFLGKTTKSWEEPVESYPHKIMIEIPDDDVEVQEEEEEMEGESELVDLEDYELTAALNAEFDRQDCVAAFEAAAEESEISEEE